MMVCSATLISLETKPTELNTSVSPLDTAMINSPLASVCEALAFPLMVTVALETGWLLGPVTFPLMLVCAITMVCNSMGSMISQVIFLICLINVCFCLL